MAALDILLLGLIFLLSGQRSHSQTCPIFGTDQVNQGDFSNRERIFLNFESPSQCRGVVTSWEYCYYRDVHPTDTSTQEYAAKFLVYRRESSGSEMYQPVTNSTIMVSITNQNLTSADFECRTLVLGASEQFEIQENDVVAACILESDPYEPLRLVGIDRSGNHELYQYNARDYEQCTAMQLQTVNTGINDFVRRSGGHQLHLYVNVNRLTNSQCNAGSNPPPFSSSTASGTFLNTASSVQCTDTITAWHYCYYPPTSSNTPTTYTATIAVWRLNNASSQYELVAGSNYTLMVQPQSTPAKIVCNTVNLQEAEYVRVNQGDVIGITVPTQNPIQMVASQASNAYSLQSSSQTNLPGTISTSELIGTANMALHLYPDIENIPVSTIAPGTTSSSTTSANSTPPQTTAANTTPPPTTVGTTTSPPTTVDTTTPPPTTVVTTTPPPTTVDTTIPPPTTVDTTTPPPTTADTTTPPPTTEASTTTTNDITTQPSTTAVDITTPPTTAAETTNSPPTTADNTTPPPTTSDTTTRLSTTKGTNIPPPATARSTSAPTTSSDMSGTSSTSSTQGSTSGNNVEEQSSSLSLGALVGVIIGTIFVVVAIGFIAGFIVYKWHVCRCTSAQTKRQRATFAVENILYQDVAQAEAHVYDGIPMSTVYEDIDTELVKGATAEMNYDIPKQATYDVPKLAPTYDVPKSSTYSVPTTVSDNTGAAIGSGVGMYSFIEKVKHDEDSKLKDENLYYSPANEESEIFEQLQNQGINMIRRKDIKIIGELGTGQFGTVEKGLWKPVNLEVAVKSLKSDASSLDRVKFLQEAAITAQFKHPNVVTLHGIVRDSNGVLIVVELLQIGDLLKHLLSLRPDSGRTLRLPLKEALLSYSQQIALGMVYLSNKGFVHRDLAARNVLISEHNICKIADFGMSRDLAQSDYYVSQGGKVPIKWTAPEAIYYKKYSTASDVWSYGCLLYEIWSLGHKPYEARRNVEVMRLVDSGWRLPPPPGCPKVIYKLMIQCWNPTTSERPAFRNTLVTLLDTEATVLHIPSEDLSTQALAGVIGAPLEAGEDMYPELQNTYQTEVTAM